jgi:YfiH family protein
MATLKQIHSAFIHRVQAPGLIGEGDGLLTDAPNTPVSIRTADCLPILLVDTNHRSVAALHAGWRGTAAGIAEKAISRMSAEFGTRAEDLIAAIGPGIGVCCYHVGEDVGKQFGLTGSGKINLAESNRRQLLTTGIPASQIDVLDRCTFCDAELFHSFRRDKERAGRMISFIEILP